MELEVYVNHGGQGTCRENTSNGGYGHGAVASEAFGGEHILVVRRRQGALLPWRDTESSVEISHGVLVVGRKQAALVSNTGVLRLAWAVDATGAHIRAS